jgi:hypothetical protein
MKEQLTKYFERMEHYMTMTPEDAKIFFHQAFGGFSFALQLVDDFDEEFNLIIWWEEEWKPRLEKIMMEV